MQKLTDWSAKRAGAMMTITGRDPETGDTMAKDVHRCPVCAEPFEVGDICATDIELGICHAACLEGSPTVHLDTGDPVDGPISTYPYETL